jgi:predicted ferric reductase
MAAPRPPGRAIGLGHSAPALAGTPPVSALGAAAIATLAQPGGPAQVDETIPTLRLAGPASPRRIREQETRLRVWLGIVGVYVVAIAGPFALVLARDVADPRPFIYELGSATGVAALSLLTLQLVLPARLSLFRPLGADVAVRLHRGLADVMLSLVAGHVVAVMAADPRRLELLRFFGEPWRAQAAIASVAALGVLIGTSVLRRRVRLSYAAWRGIHYVLGGTAFALALVHTVGVNRYLVSGPAVVGLGGLGLAGIVGLAALRSRRLRSGSVRQYIVERVVPERGGAVTLELRADGHEGQSFDAGQFAWLKLAKVRASFAEHPFSYSSSAATPQTPTFTMKQMRGFTAAAAEFPPGTRLLVDGPHGAFRFRPDARGMILIAGGIGITPSMSLLKTAADDGDRRPFLLLYANRTADGITFAEEIEALRGRLLNLRVVHVLSAPPPDWSGERGRINAGLLERNLPRDPRGWQSLVCGSGPFVDAAVESLDEAGVPAERVHAERFVEV